MRTVSALLSIGASTPHAHGRVIVHALTGSGAPAAMIAGRSPGFDRRPGDVTISCDQDVGTGFER